MVAAQWKTESICYQTNNLTGLDILVYSFLTWAERFRSLYIGCDIMKYSHTIFCCAKLKS